MCGNPRPLSGMKIKCLCQSGVVFSAHKALWKTQESLSILQSLFYDLGQIFRSCHECLLWDYMEDLTKAAMWRAAAIFRFRIQKNYCGMILILQVLLCNYLSCLSDRLQDTSGEFQRLHCIICLFWPYYPANLSVFSKRYEWSYTNTMRRGQIVDWSMFCCSRWHSACSFVVTTFIWRAAAAVGSRPYQ